MAMNVDILPEAEAELLALSLRDLAEHTAMLRAINKLELFGSELPFRGLR